MGYEKPSITTVGSVADKTLFFDWDWDWPWNDGGDGGGHGGGHGGVS